MDIMTLYLVFHKHVWGRWNDFLKIENILLYGYLTPPLDMYPWPRVQDIHILEKLMDIIPLRLVFLKYIWEERRLF